MCAANPYLGLPAQAFWRQGVVDRPGLVPDGLWTPAFPIHPDHRIVTAGSCFAQHIGRALSARGFGWVDAEPAPRHMDTATAQRFGYGLFSFRTGNIYTARMLMQWLRWATGAEPVPDGDVWEDGGRFFDPFRPAIEPDGFASADELRASRAATLAAIRSAVDEADVLVFTLGLTECWRDRVTGAEYAMCPGTVAGHFDPDRHAFHNQRPGEILRDLRAAVQLLARRNPRLKVLLTVSPVPLTATASGQHVLVATSQSKAILRAAAGILAEDSPAVDYFPSFELITAPTFRGVFFAGNQRNVLPEGVAHVMGCFFDSLEARFGPVPARGRDTTGARPDPAGVVGAEARSRRGGRRAAVAEACEEAVLAAFRS